MRPQLHGYLTTLGAAWVARVRTTVSTATGGALRNRGFLALLALLIAALTLGLAACGGDDDEDAGGEDTVAATTEEGGAGGEGTTVKIVSDLPLQGSDRVQTEQMVRAIEYVLEQADNKAGPHTIEFESFDDATAAKGAWDEAKCAENARTYV